MPLLDDVRVQYFLDHPEREGRPIPFTDIEITILKVIDRQLGRKLDRYLPPPQENKAATDGR
jgi:hypothetical protein